VAGFVVVCFSVGASTSSSFQGYFTLTTTTEGQRFLTVALRSPGSASRDLPFGISGTETNIEFKTYRTALVSSTLAALNFRWAYTKSLLPCTKLEVLTIVQPASSIKRRYRSRRTSFDCRLATFKAHKMRRLIKIQARFETVLFAFDLLLG
jgi:hypothetical protein